MEICVHILICFAKRVWKFDWDVSIYTKPQTVPAETIAQIDEEGLTEAMVAQQELARREIRVNTCHFSYPDF